MPEGFRIASAFVQVSPDTEGFREELQARLEEALAGVEARARVTLDTTALDAAADRARARVESLDEAHATARVRLDSEELDAGADEARATLDELGERHATASADLDAGPLEESAERAEARLERLGERTARPRVTLDRGEFDAEVDEAEARLAALGLWRDSAGRLRDSRGRFAGGAGSSEGGGEGGSGPRWRTPVGGGSGSAPGWLSSVAGAAVPSPAMLLGGLGISSLIPAIAPLGTVLGVGGLTAALGLGGIGKAVSDAHQASLNVGITPQQQAATAFSNQVAQRQGQDQVSQARKQAAQDAITSANSIQQAQMNLASVERNSAEQQIQALQSVKQAQQGVEEADYALSEAQYNLNQAWEAARENLRQLDDQLADSKLNVQQAELAIQQAEYQQRLTDQNAYSTSLDRQQAALAVAQAQQRLTDAQDQLTDSTYAANRAHQEGVAGSQTVIQAQQAVTAAQYGQADAHAQLQDAQAQQTLTQLNNADQLKQAQMQLAAAEEQASFQRQQDAHAIAVAEQNLTDTIREQQLQLAATESTANQAANQFALDMARLSPAAQEVVKQILSMRGAFHDLEMTAQTAIAPGVMVLLQGLQSMVPTLVPAVAKVGAGISGVFASIGKALESSGAKDVFNGLLDNGMKIAGALGPALGGIAEALGKIGSQKGAADGVANAIGAIGKTVAAFVTGLSPFTGALSGLLTPISQALIPIGQQLGPLFGQLAQAIGPALAQLLPPFQKLITALGAGLSPIIQALGPLLVPIATAIGAVADAIDPLLVLVGSLAGQLLQGLTPILQALQPIVALLAETLSKELQQGLGEMLKSLLPLFPPLAQLVVSLTPIIDLVIKLAALIMDLAFKVEVPLTQAIVWIISKFAELLSHWQVVVSGIEAGASWLVHNVFEPLWSGLSKGADQFVKDFGLAWGALEDVFKVPVNFLIGTVYTNGIESLWNGVVKAIGQDSLVLPDIKQLASGGVLPGYAPGQDTVPAMLSPGEGVLVPEAVRALGPGTVLALNAMFGGGRVSTPGHFKGGGLISDITGGISGAWHDVTGALGKSFDLAKVVAAVATGDTSGLNAALGKLLGTNASGNYAKLLLGVPTALVHDAVQAVASLFGGAPKPSAPTSGSSAPVTGTVSQWFADAVAATGAPAGWIPSLETIGSYESGNNPRAENDWDSNAKAGDPSRGVMQTIMSTFLGYHQSGTSSDIFDPVANIASAINYIKSRYGDVFNVPGIKSLARGGPYVGYDSGGWLMPSGLPVNGLGRPEAVLTPEESQAFVAIVRHLTQQGGGGQGIGSRGVVVNFNGTQYPTAEQMAAIHREMGLALSG